MERDLAEHFGEAIAGARFERLPLAAIDAAKKTVLDTLGVILAGSGMAPTVRPVLELVREAGGAPESALLGVGGRAPATAAALANGAMAHCLDFDDRTPWGRHCGSSLIPAALALAEKRRGVSGRQLITAIAVGQDMFIRLRRHIERDEAWNLSTVLGVLSASAAASVVLGLDRRGTTNALGIASTQASGTMQLVHSGSDLRGMYAGFSAQAAVTSTLLAQKGVQGVDGALEGEAGLFRLCFPDGYDRAAMLDGLGTTYLGGCMGYKPWPVVGLAHTFIHATLELMREHRLAAADIERIEVFIGEKHRELCAPLARRRAPQSAIEAKFSLPFCVALAAARGGISVCDFNDSALNDAVVLALAEKVVPSETGTTTPRTDEVRVTVRGGQMFSRDGRDAPGGPNAPMTWNDVTRKFFTCAAAAAIPLSASSTQLAVELVERLERLDDVAQVVQALAC